MSPRKSKSPETAPQNLTHPAELLAASRLANVNVPIPTTPMVKPIPADDDFVVGSKWTPIRQTGAYESSCWLFAPARIEFLAEASDALVTVAELMGLAEKKIAKVEVVLQRSTKCLFFRPATETSVSYFDVGTTSNDYLSINIRSLLQENGLEVKTGYQERYPVVLDPDSVVGPALVVDLRKLQARRLTAAKKARKAAKVGAKVSGEAAPVKTGKAKRGKAKAAEKVETAAKVEDVTVTADKQATVLDAKAPQATTATAPAEKAVLPSDTMATAASAKG